MAKRPRNRSERPSHPPLWLVEGLDIVHRKRLLLAAVVVAVVVLGALFAVLFPGVMPRTPEVGAAIGLAALLLGLAAAVATDATDLVVRGPRHVAAAGGELVAVLPREPSVAAAGPLAAAVLEVREPGVPLLLALATAGRDARRSNSWTDAIARALVAEGVGVLRVDLASGRSEQPGLVEVVRDGLRLADAVTFEPGLKLAHLTAGHDHGEALLALTELPGRLPRDLDIMLVSLPTVASRSVVSAATALDHVLVVVERDRTSRVDLIASLDALEAAGTHAQAVLLDTQTALRLAPPVEATPETPGGGRRTISSTVGTAPVVLPGSEEAPADVSAEVSADEETPADEGPREDAGDDLAMSEEEGPPVDGGDELAVSEEETAQQPSSTSAGEDADGSLAASDDEERDDTAVGDAEGLDAEPDDEETADEPASSDETEPGAEGSADQLERPTEADDGPAGGPHLEGSEASEPADDRGETAEPAGEQRALELLEAAAAATAMSVAGAEDEPLDEHLDELPAAHDLEDELPQPDAPPLVEEVVELPAAGSPEPEADVEDDVEIEQPSAADDVEDDLAEPGATADGVVGADEVQQEDDPTDRLPPVTVADPAEGELFAADDEDLLRTTAQLAMLADDLELRSQGRLDTGDRAETERRPPADDDEHDGRG